MTVEILKDAIETPAQNNLTWVFHVRVDGREPIPWKVDSFDLNNWFKEVFDRYPRHEKGDKDEKEDILNNWSQFEPRLRVEAEKEAGLPVKIGVDGMRFSTRYTDEARSIPPDQLPPLSDPQRAAAESMGVSEEAYARNLVVGEKTWNELLEKTKRLADVLQHRLAELATEAKLETVILRTFDRTFDAEIRLEDRTLPVRIRESIIDDLFEGGSEQAKVNIDRILGIALSGRIIQ